MALSTKNIKTGESKLNKAITPGNTVGKIYDLALKPGYNPESYYLVLMVETEPIENFEGFFIDPSNQSKGRHQGQVGRIRSSQYAYETKVLPSGNKVDRDDNILKFLKTIAICQNTIDALDEVNADTIEEFVENAKRVVCNDTYLNFCVGGKAYTNKEGYVAYDCFLPKMDNKKYAISNSQDTVLTFNESKHIVGEVKKQAESVESFEPQSSGSDFDMF
jgi:hypothetical protein